VMGVNARMDEIQAAILRVKLPYLDRWNEARRSHAEALSERLRGVVTAVPETRSWATHAYYVYVVQVPDRDRVREKLALSGILTGVHYPIPLHLQPACRGYGYQVGSLPVTEAAAEHILSLPMYAELTAEQVELIAGCLVEALQPAVAHR
jgi:dTDP-4-amino-4,6-dideoxygalactose transaminase